jgi:hypothetical protein
MALYEKVFDINARKFITSCTNGKLHYRNLVIDPENICGTGSTVGLKLKRSKVSDQNATSVISGATQSPSGSAITKNYRFSLGK